MLREYPDLFGVFMTPRPSGRYKQALDSCSVWAMDNDRYNFSGSRWPEAEYIKTLDDCLPWREKCAFVLAPDVVGDARSTLREFPRWYGAISEYGYPVALAAQDGMQIHDVPWLWVSALFIGGSTEWKLSHEAAVLVKAAKHRKLWVHVGRVNGKEPRGMFAAKLGADSIDGTNENKEPGILQQWLWKMRCLRSITSGQQLRMF